LTNGGRPDGQAKEKKPPPLSVRPPAVRLEGEHQGDEEEGEVVRYALLVYGNVDIRDRTTQEERRRINAEVDTVLARPNVTGWVRLEEVETATTVHYREGRTLLTDGPFVDSKDYLGGFIVVEAENLDGALAVAEELQLMRTACAMEVRPVREEPLVDA
jgi:hypothetical protein